MNNYLYVLEIAGRGIGALALAMAMVACIILLFGIVREYERFYRDPECMLFIACILGLLVLLGFMFLWDVGVVDASCLWNNNINFPLILRTV